MGACSVEGMGWVVGPAGRGGQSDNGRPAGRGCVTAAAQARLFRSKRPRRPPRTKATMSSSAQFSGFNLLARACASATTTINKPLERATGLMLAESAPSTICCLLARRSFYSTNTLALSLSPLLAAAADAADVFRRAVRLLSVRRSFARCVYTRFEKKEWERKEGEGRSDEDRRKC